MLEKTIIILSKSFKHGGNCIAGRELIEDVGRSNYKVGKWIRPVSRSGAIKGKDCIFENGRQAQLLDIVTITFLEHQPINGQPENFLIDSGYYWGKNEFDYAINLQDFIQQPESLWQRDIFVSDYVTAESINQHPPDASLYFIKPQKLSLNLYWWGKRRLKAIFYYENDRYELQVTDPLVWKYLDSQFPKEGEPDKRITLPKGDKYYLCISLAGEWEGKHYKLVATILDVNGKLIK
ncbi:MAG: hypothetical protein ACFFDT_00120 [Candidatus Hodarchaeota archaeon]